ncbi:hypothetical protein [Zavarzinella formosa]|uniref:hypothetical protein n=1 Tax=Zavarzinella formosa TaxID=360055 RepID=UPI0002EE3D0D|nr:hypothetical protein [Zavarzinella formosa]
MKQLFVLIAGLSLAHIACAELKHNRVVMKAAGFKIVTWMDGKSFPPGSAIDLYLVIDAPAGLKDFDVIVEVELFKANDKTSLRRITHNVRLAKTDKDGKAWRGNVKNLFPSQESPDSSELPSEGDYELQVTFRRKGTFETTTARQLICVADFGEY